MESLWELFSEKRLRETNQLIGSEDYSKSVVELHHLHPERISLEIEENKLTKYNWLVQFKDNFELGNKTDIGAFTYINAKNGVVIEDEVQIGSHCSIYSISTIDEKEGKVLLKKKCKIGSHSIIMPGVTIGENAIVGAFAFVNKDVPANSKAIGIPIKIIEK